MPVMLWLTARRLRMGQRPRRTWFRELLKRLDVVDPDAVATQLMLLVDGAIAAALVRGDPKVARAAREAAPFC
jgi:hypothetical protein